MRTSITYSLLISVVLFGFHFSVQSQTTINVHIKDLADVDCYLAYYYGDKQYIKDTFHLDSKGKAVILSKETTPPGIYLLVYPNKSYTEFLYDKGNLSVSIESANPTETVKFTSSLSNTLFAERNLFLQNTRAKAEKLKNERTDLNGEETDKKLADIDKDVAEYDRMLCTKYPNEMISEILKAFGDPEIPQHLTEKQERYEYYKAHYFDNVNFSCKWIIRSPIFNSKITRYIDDLTIQHYDSINNSVDEILTKTMGNDELFKYATITLVNKYANSQLMTATNTYCHIIKKYYLSGLATWSDSINMEKLRTRYNALKNNVVGVNAIPLILEDLDGEVVSTGRNYRPEKYKFTVLYFWSDDCGNCKKTADELKKFCQEKDEDVEVIGIQTNPLIANYREFVESNGYNWFHTRPRPMEEGYRNDYDVYSLPTIYILDKNDVIIARRIGVEQLQSVIDFSRE